MKAKKTGDRVPTSIDDFGCFLVLVSGEKIDSESAPSQCTASGTMTTSVGSYSAVVAKGAELLMQIPAGSERKFEVFGADVAATDCDLESTSRKNIAFYPIGEKSTHLLTNTTVEIPIAWTGGTPHSLLCHEADPGAFTISSAVANNSQVTVNWNASTDADFYTVKWGTVSGTYPNSVSDLTTLTRTVTGLTNGTTYYFMVTAHNLKGTRDAASEFSQVPAPPPQVTNVSSPNSDGIKGVSSNVPVSITFDQIVNVTGTPQITLETGATDTVVNYVSGSGSTVLVFTYTVAAGHTSSDLDYVNTTALALNGGSIVNASGVPAVLALPAPGAAGSLGANKNFVIDGVAGTVTNVTSSTANGSYVAGSPISIQVTFSEVMTVTGTPTLTLETGATDQVVSYSTGSGTSTLTFDYTVATGDLSADLDYVATNSLALAGGTIVDAASNAAVLTLPAPAAAGSLGANKNIVVDAVIPVVTSVTSSAANGTYGSGAVIPIQVVFSEVVNISATPQLTLETGSPDAVVSYSSGSGTNTLTFNYTVASPHVAADLDYTSTTALVGNIKDAALNSWSGVLPNPGAAGSLGANKNIGIDATAPYVIDVNSAKPNATYGLGTPITITVQFNEAVTVSGTPQLQLETGLTDAIINYVSGSGTDTLSFLYTVGVANATADLNYKATNSLTLNGGTILDGSSNPATLTLPGLTSAGALGVNKDLAIDAFSDYVTDVTATEADGPYGVGATIHVKVTFSDVMTVTGSPILNLETGSTDRDAVYATGDGTNTLTFNYVVVAGDSSADLNYTSAGALSLNAGTIKDSLGNNADLVLPTIGSAGSLAVNKNIQIDTGAPTVLNVTAVTGDGTYKNGDSVSIQVTFSENVTVTGGTPKLKLETGSTDALVSYSSGSGSAVLTFDYTVAPGDLSSDLEYESTGALSLNGAAISDGINNAILTLPNLGSAQSLGGSKSLVIDGVPPMIVSVSSSAANAIYVPGDVIPVLVTFSESVSVTGTPQIVLETGTVDQTVDYTLGSGSSLLQFDYTVQTGDASSDLDYKSNSALTGTIKDAAGNLAVLTLANPGSANSLGNNKAIVIDGVPTSVVSVSTPLPDGTYEVGTIVPIKITFNRAVTVTGSPLLQLETGATDASVMYTSGSLSTVLTFQYAIATGQNANDLEYTSTAALTLNGGTIKDAQNNGAVLTLPATYTANSLGGSKNIKVDTSDPVVVAVSSTAANAAYGVGQTIPILVQFDEPVTVSGTPKITLETGSPDTDAFYVSGSGTDTLRFDYLVAAGNTSPDLDYVPGGLQANGGTIQDSLLHNANLLLVAPGTAGSLGANKNIAIDTNAPSVLSVHTTKSDGTYGIGTSIPIEVNFNDVVNVTGTPTLTLSTGGTSAVVDYSSGSGTSTLVFTYTVALGHISADLDYQGVTALVLPGGATLTDTAGNAAVLSLPTPGALNSLSYSHAIVINGVAPTVTNVTSSTTNGTYKTGDSIAIQVTFSSVVYVTGLPALKLETGVADAEVIVVSGDGTNTLSFFYSILAGHDSPDLSYFGTTPLNLNGGTIKDSDGNDAILNFPAPGAVGSLSFNKDLVVDTTAPKVVNVSSTKTAGTYVAGQTIDIQITFDEPVFATVSPAPYLLLETGSTDQSANYSTGSGSDTLTFNYVVAAGDETADLDYTTSLALILNGGSIHDFVNNDADLSLPMPGAVHSLSANEAIQIDAVVPYVVDVTSDKVNGSYGIGSNITITVQFNEPITVAGGAPSLTLETGSIDTAATYSSTDTDKLVMSYTVVTGDDTSDLNYQSINALVSAGATIRDAAGNDANLQLPATSDIHSLGANKQLLVDGIVPQVSSVMSLSPGGTYQKDAMIELGVVFTENIQVTGVPELKLETGTNDTAAIFSGVINAEARFGYTVALGDENPDLEYHSQSALTLPGGATIKDLAGNTAVLTLPPLNSVGSLAYSSALIIDGAPFRALSVTSPDGDGYYNYGDTIDIEVTFSRAIQSVTGSPKILMENGAGGIEANYVSFSGAVAFFQYVIGSTDNNPDLDYKTTSPLSGGNFMDAGSNTALLTLPAPGAVGSLSFSRAMVVDTIVPFISGIDSPSGTATFANGGLVPIDVHFNEAVIVGGTPSLQLETGSLNDGVANYESGSLSNTLRLNYLVDQSHTSTDLDYQSTNSFSKGGTLTDLAGNTQTFLLVAPGAPGSLGDNESISINANLPILQFSKAGTEDGGLAGWAVAGGGANFNAGTTNDVVYGAPYQDSPASDGGVFHVIDGSGTALFFKGCGSNACQYGASLATGDFNGDGTSDVLAGAPTRAAGYGGADFVDGASGIHPVLSSPTAPQAGAHFGAAVAVIGDLRDAAGNPGTDGILEFAVGAPDFDDSVHGFTDAGRVMVFNGANASLLLDMVGTESIANLGFSVAGGGDFDGVGQKDLLATAPKKDGSGTDRGVAYAVLGEDLLTTAGTTPGQENNGQLGFSSAFVGDIDSDGKADYVLGAPYEDAAGTDRGKVYVMSGANHTPLFTFSGLENGGAFGWSVAGAGDVDGDSKPDIVVGAPLQDGVALNCGKAYIFSGATGRVLYHFEGGELNGQLGFAVAGAGDVNDDGLADVVIGAPNQDEGGTDRGTVYVYRSNFPSSRNFRLPESWPLKISQTLRRGLAFPWLGLPGPRE